MLLPASSLDIAIPKIYLNKQLVNYLVKKQLSSKYLSYLVEYKADLLIPLIHRLATLLKRESNKDFFL